MPMGILFWVLMILWLIFGGWLFWPNFGTVGFYALAWVLFALLGWKSFGPPIQ